MNLTLDCPSCRRTILVQADCLGKPIACPLCKGEFVAALPLAALVSQPVLPASKPVEVDGEPRRTLPTWLLGVASLLATAGAMAGVWYAMKDRTPVVAVMEWRKITLPDTQADALFPPGEPKWADIFPEGIFNRGKEATASYKDHRYIAGWRSFDAKDGADKPFEELVQPERKRLANGFKIAKEGPLQFQVGKRKFEGIEWEATKAGETQHGRAVIQVVPPEFRVYFLAVTGPKTDPGVVSKFLNGLTVE